MKTSGITSFFLLTFNTAVSAYPLCRAQVGIETYNQHFLGNLFILLLPILILAVVGFGLYHFDKISNKIRKFK